jgi:hypothetical protein
MNRVRNRSTTSLNVVPGFAFVRHNSSRHHCGEYSHAAHTIPNALMPACGSSV